jgi:hypothetical protein
LASLGMVGSVLFNGLFNNSGPGTQPVNAAVNPATPRDESVLAVGS